MKKNESVETMSGIINRGKAMLLAGLVLLGSSAYGMTATAENKEMISTDYFSGFTFERFPMETIFDMTIQDSQRPVIPEEIWLIHFKDRVTSKNFYIPATMKEFTVIKDKQKDTKKNKALLEEGKGILVSELKEYLTDSFIKKINSGGKKYEKINMYCELISNVVIAYSSTNRQERHVDFEYLAKYAVYDGDKNKVSSSYAIFPYRLRDYIDMQVINKALDKEDVPYELLDQEMTLERYLTDVYMSIVPYSYWPADIVYHHDDTFIPEFTEEKKNQSIGSINAGIGLVMDINDALVKIIVYKYDENSKEYFDFYTGQRMELERVEAWLEIYFKPHQLEEPYSILSGYGSQVARENQIFLPFRRSSYPIKLFEKYTQEYHQEQNNEKKFGPYDLLFTMFEDISYITRLRPYYDLINKVNENTAIGEMNDYYFGLPSRYIIDYTGFDFSNNPDVINAEESKTE